MKIIFVVGYQGYYSQSVSSTDPEIVALMLAYLKNPSHYVFFVNFGFEAGERIPEEVPKCILELDGSTKVSEEVMSRMKNHPEKTFMIYRKSKKFFEQSILEEKLKEILERLEEKNQVEIFDFTDLPKDAVHLAKELNEYEKIRKNSLIKLH